MFSSSPKVDPQRVYLSSQFLFQKATSMSSSGQKSSSVAQTCNLLSQYFKENGRFASKPAANQGNESDSRQQATTMNLLPNLENSAEISKQDVKANDFFANIPSLAASNVMNEAISGQGTSQMTIFYAGKVFVFSDFPAEKAKEIMALATKAASSNVIPDLNMASTFRNNNNDATPLQFPSASLQRFFDKRKER
ncbi:protein TIFY 10A [Citrus sinensis]|nr:protein TIFY 10A [Citrus sinensis]